MLWARALADVLVAVHVAYVGFVVIGMAAIALGLVLRWRWVRSFSFRVAHLAAISVVAGESIAGIPCPLTTWERALRVQSGQHAIEGDFIATWAHRLIFFQAEPWVFTILYASFGALVFFVFVIAPPRRPVWRMR